MLKITAYADALLAGLDDVDWPDSTKEMQRNWIGRSEGAEIDFPIDGAPDLKLRVFTTRPDTLFGATYMVLAPEHELVSRLTSAEQRAAVDAYREQAARKSELERAELQKEKTGVFTGAYAINPANGREDPDLDRRLRARELRHRRDHGRAGAGPTRLGFRENV